VSDIVSCVDILGMRESPHMDQSASLTPAELSILTLRQLYVARVDGRRVCINVKMTDGGQNPIHTYSIN
jgi:hypothetical protein